MDFQPNAPEKEEVQLAFAESGLKIGEWTEYQVSSHFETPTDGWEFTVGGEQVDETLRAALIVGARVRLTINNLPQCDGYIDSIEVHASRNGGVEYRISGRDRLAQMVDSCADPTKSFKQGQTLEQVMLSLFGQFGWSSPDQFNITNEGDLDVKTGVKRGFRTSKKKGKPLKEAIYHLRPKNHEGVFAFAARILGRFGLWAWLTADGEKVVIASPDFEQEPLYKLVRSPNQTNILEGTVRFDITDQPTVIIADGVSGGGEFGRSKIKSKAYNTAVRSTDKDDPEPFDKADRELFDRYRGASEVRGYEFSAQIRVPRHRPLFLHDDESHTQEQLDFFLRRELAKLQRRSLQVSYIVEGHGQETPLGFIPWTVDTVVDVDDQIAGLRERLYVLARTFIKSRSGGTTTRLDLIRLHTLSFEESPT